MPALRLSLEKSSSIFSCEMLTDPVVSRSNHFSSPTSNNTSHPPCNKCCEFDLFQESWCLCQPGWISVAFLQHRLGTPLPRRYLHVKVLSRSDAVRMSAFDSATYRLVPCMLLHCHCLSITYSFSMLSLTEVIAQDLNTTVVSQAGKPSQKIPSMITANIVRSDICST